MAPGKQEGNTACEVLDAKERKSFQGEGLPPFRMLPIAIYLASFTGLAICQGFHTNHPTQLISSLGVGVAQTFLGPTHLPSPKLLGVLAADTKGCTPSPGVQKPSIHAAILDTLKGPSALQSS